MRTPARGSLVTAMAVVALALTACSSTSAAAPAASSTDGGGGARMDPAQQQKIAQCLQAAGLPVPSVTRPSRAPGAPPPTRTPGQNRGGGAFADPEVRAALQACGITLPTRAPGASARPAPTA